MTELAISRPVRLGCQKRQIYRTPVVYDYPLFLFVKGGRLQQRLSHNLLRDTRVSVFNWEHIRWTEYPTPALDPLTQNQHRLIKTVRYIFFLNKITDSNLIINTEITHARDRENLKISRSRIKNDIAWSNSISSLCDFGIIVGRKPERWRAN